MSVKFSNLGDQEDYDDYDAYADYDQEDDYYFGAVKEQRFDDKKAAHVDGPDKANKSFSRSASKKFVEAVYAIENADENLGEDFEETPWLPPSIDKAIEFSNHHIYKGGNAILRYINITGVGDLGVGIPLYFQFVKSMAVVFFVMSVLSIPSLYFSYNGSRIRVEDQDSGGMYKFTIGNIGYDPYSSTYATDSQCSSTMNSTMANATDLTGQCIHVGGTEFTTEDVSSLITVFEFLQVLCFFFSVVHLQRKFGIFRADMDRKACSLKNYSVMIRNLPKDATRDELIAHFSNLYQLSEPDWRGRYPIKYAEPVVCTDNTGEEKYKGTWIAECTVHREIGVFVTAFKEKQSIMEDIYRYRAQMKMYGEDTTHAHGPQPKKYAKAEYRMLLAAATLDMHTEAITKNKGMKLAKNKVVPDLTIDSGDVEAPVAGGSGKDNIESNIEADAVAAFIIFQYSESYARCIEDYKKYSRFPYNFCYFPNEMLFRGQTKLKISIAPEPDEIVWENLEVSFATKMFRRFRTNFAAIIIVIICFNIILLAATYKQAFVDSIPLATVCDTEIPALYKNSYSDLGTMELARINQNKDLECQVETGDSGAFHAQYVDDVNSLVGTYDIDSCSSVYHCPTDSSSLCPCISTQAIGECESLSCSTGSWSGRSCVTFSASDIGSCYCQKTLVDILTKNSGILDTVNAINEETAPGAACKDYIIEYSLATTLSYVAMATGIFVNTLINIFLKYFSKRECYTSTDAEQGSLMFKSFVAQYFNLAIVVILAFGKSDGVPEFLAFTKLFSGAFSDFTIGWYGVVGSILIGSFVIQALFPVLFDLFHYFITQPFYRFWFYPAVTKVESVAFPMQHDLDMLGVGPIFDVTTHSAHILTLLFFGMTYAAGIPVMNILMFISFTLFFFIDRMLLCRYYQKPPKMGEKLIQIMLKCLPWVALIRLAVACWMLGADGILESPYVYTPDPTSSYYALEKRVYRNNVFPLFIFIICIIIIKVIRKVWHYLPIYWIFMFLKATFNFLNGKSTQVYTDSEGFAHPWDLLKQKHPLRHEIAPFTGDYYTIVADQYDIPNGCFDILCCLCRGPMDDYNLTENEIIDGWAVMNMLEHYTCRVKTWQQLVNIDGVVHSNGEVKTTFAVVNDISGISSYSLDRVPAYKMAMQGMKEGTASLMEHQANKRQGMQQAASVGDLFAIVEHGGESLVDQYRERRTRIDESRKLQNDWGLGTEAEPKKGTSSNGSNDPYNDDDDDEEEEEDYQYEDDNQGYEGYEEGYGEDYQEGYEEGYT